MIHRERNNARERVKRTMKKILAWILSVLLLLGSVSLPAAFAEDNSSSSVMGSSIRNANKELVPDYVHFDPTDLLSECTKLEKNDWAGKEKEAIELYDKLLEKINFVNTNNTVISIMNDEDLTNKSVEEEYLYSQSTTQNVVDSFLIACHALATGPVASAFEKHVDPLDFAYMRDYKPVTDEEQKINDRISELELEYNNLMNSGMYELKATVGGREYTFEDFNDEQLFEELDPDQRIALYLDLAGQLNEKAGKIYLELISLRNQSAKMRGFDSFVEFADKEWYSRDFGTDEAKQFYKTVKSFFNERGQYMDIPDLQEKETSVTYLFDTIDKVMGGKSAVLDDSLSYLKTNGLCSIGNESTRVNGAYTSSLPNVPGNAFIFQYTTDTTYDVTALIHELGHFANSHTTKTLECYNVQFEVAEIHSTGLQMLAADRYDLAMDKEEAKNILAYQLCESLLSIQSGALYDEWQRQIYTHPDMTLKQINDLYYSLAMEYGVAETYGMEYDWMFVNHNFTSPMYYISYAVSALSALELWDMSHKDYAGAVKTWESVLNVCTPFSYFDTMKTSGLSTFTDEKAVTKILTNAYDTYIDSVYDDDFFGFGEDFFGDFFSEFFGEDFFSDDFFKDEFPKNEFPKNEFPGNDYSENVVSL